MGRRWRKFAWFNSFVRKLHAIFKLSTKTDIKNGNKRKKKCSTEGPLLFPNTNWKKIKRKENGPFYLNKISECDNFSSNSSVWMLFVDVIDSYLKIWSRNIRFGVYFSLLFLLFPLLFSPSNGRMWWITQWTLCEMSAYGIKEVKQLKQMRYFKFKVRSFIAFDWCTLHKSCERKIKIQFEVIYLINRNQTDSCTSVSFRDFGLNFGFCFDNFF